MKGSRFAKAVAFGFVVWLVIFDIATPFTGSMEHILMCFIELVFSLPAIVIFALLVEFTSDRK